MWIGTANRAPSFGVVGAFGADSVLETTEWIPKETDSECHWKRESVCASFFGSPIEQSLELLFVAFVAAIVSCSNRK